MRERTAGAGRARLERRPVAAAELDRVARAALPASRAGPERRAAFDAGALIAAAALAARLADSLFLLGVGRQVFLLAQRLARAAVRIRASGAVVGRVEREAVATAPADRVGAAFAGRAASPRHLTAGRPPALHPRRAGARVLAHAPVRCAILFDRRRSRRRRRARLRRTMLDRRRVR